MGNQHSRRHPESPHPPPPSGGPSRIQRPQDEVIRPNTQNYFHALPLMPQHDISLYDARLSDAYERILRRDLIDVAARVLCSPLDTINHLTLQNQTFNGHMLMYFTYAALDMLMHPDGERVRHAEMQAQAILRPRGSQPSAPSRGQSARHHSPGTHMQPGGARRTTTTTTTSEPPPPPPSTEDIINPIALQTLLERIERLYFALPFHNDIRAATRVHAAFRLLQKIPNVFSPEHMFAFMLVAAMRDMQHPGLTNSFQNNANSALARLYNFDLPTENHACSTLFHMMREDVRCDALSHLSPAQRKEIRDMIVYLCADASHYNIKLFANDLDASAGYSQDSAALTVEPRLSLPLLLHLAENSHLWMFDLEAHLYWLSVHACELAFQRDFESRLGIPISFPPRAMMAASYYSLLQRHFELVDAALYIISRFIPLDVSRLSTNSGWWSTHSSENPHTPVYQNLTGPYPQGYDTPEHCHYLLNNSIVQRRVPRLEMSTPIESHQETARHWLHILTGDTYPQRYRELYDIVFAAFSSQEGFRVPENIQPRPVLMLSKFDEESERNVMRLSHDDRTAGILYLAQHYQDMSFDIFSLTGLLGDAPLVFVGMLVFEGRNLLHEFRIPQTKLFRFLHTMQSSYFANPYHNAIHAADVLQACDVILRRTLDHTKMSRVFVLALLLAAIAHDNDHPGTNNVYAVNSCSYLATLYSDRSVLEAHSASRFIDLLENQECNILENVGAEMRAQIRALVISCVLCTDMSLHKTLVDRFKALKPCDFSHEGDAQFVCGMVLKMADISNSLRGWRVYENWARRVSEEFFRQGDLEKRQGFPVGAANDRDKVKFEPGQIFFLRALVGPLLDTFIAHFPKAADLKDNLEANIKELEKGAAKKGNEAQ